MNSFLKLLLALALVLCVSATSVPIVRPPQNFNLGNLGGTRVGPLVGGYSPRSPLSLPRNIDSLVRRSRPELRLARIIKVESQVVAGTNWKIIYQAATGRYEVVVFDQPWTRTTRVTNFRRV